MPFQKTIEHMILLCHNLLRCHICSLRLLADVPEVGQTVGRWTLDVLIQLLLRGKGNVQRPTSNAQRLKILHFRLPIHPLSLESPAIHAMKQILNSQSSRRPGASHALGDAGGVMEISRWSSELCERIPPDHPHRRHAPRRVRRESSGSYRQPIRGSFVFRCDPVVFARASLDHRQISAIPLGFQKSSGTYALATLHHISKCMTGSRACPALCMAADPQAKDLQQASPGQARHERRPRKAVPHDPRPERAAHPATPFQGLICFGCNTQGGARSSLALGRLASGLWPAIQPQFKVSSRL